MLEFSSFRLGKVLCAALGSLMFLGSHGCSPKGEQTASLAPREGLYGPPKGVASSAIPRARMVGEQPVAAWTNAPFWFLETELSPATLYHSTTKHFSCFTGMKEAGLGAPTFAVFNGAEGPRPVKAGSPMDPSAMQECWVMVWFAGAPGWTNWDSPWIVCLQHQPSSMKLNEDGLHFEFPSQAGYVALMPLYGYAKPPQAGREIFSQPGPKEKHLKTWEWQNRIPKEVFHRVRYWAAALREFPVHCEESFSVDRSRDAVTIRSKFSWISIDDDWHTKHLKLAPISPPLAHAWKEKFPVTFSRKVLDMDLFTPYGPYAGVQDVDEFDATLPVLKYVNETEAPPSASAIQALLASTATNQVARAALERLRRTAAAKFRQADRYEYDHGGLKNFCWAIQGDQWYAKALPYMDEATRSTAMASLRNYFHRDVLVTNRFVQREFPKGSGQGYSILEGPGIGSWNVLGDAGKFSANLLETLWAYAHFTGDWDLIRDRWPLVKSLFTTPAEARWATFGRETIAELGDEAAPCMAFARMAYNVGDMDAYHYGCQMFARELVHHWLKQRGAAYFRERQPWHSMEAMDEEVYLTNLWGDTAGWQIDGPRYPAKTGERQYQNRWVRFKDADVGRFYRDHLRGEVEHELALLQSRWDARRRWSNDSHIMPSLVQLRSLLLNESPEALARVALPEQFSGPPSGVIASCVAVLRTSFPLRHERLIPGGEASPFVIGLERLPARPGRHLTQSLRSERRERGDGNATPHWPEITWWGWKSPAKDRWSFGKVTPVVEGEPMRPVLAPLNWTAQVTAFELSRPNR